MRQNHGPPTQVAFSGNLNLHFAGISASLSGLSFNYIDFGADACTMPVLGHATTLAAGAR